MFGRVCKYVKSVVEVSKNAGFYKEGWRSYVKVCVEWCLGFGQV